MPPWVCITLYMPPWCVCTGCSLPGVYVRGVASLGGYGREGGMLRRVRPLSLRGIGTTRRVLYPFHCWSTVPALTTFPFHCWSIISSLVQQCSLCRVSLLSLSFSRFTVGQLFHSRVIIPVSLLASSSGPYVYTCLIPHNLYFLDNLAPTNRQH